MSLFDLPEADPEFVARVQAATDLLESIITDRKLLVQLSTEQREALLMAAGRASKPDIQSKIQYNKERRRTRRKERRAVDEAKLERSGIRKKRNEEVFQTPYRTAPKELLAYHPDGVPEEEIHVEERRCYVCKTPFTVLHHFYDQMCGECGDFNFEKRHQTADLTGRTALVTGSRVKIGYQAAILMLRAGAKVVVTTRFPRDAAARYAREADFGEWKDRLEIFGLDLRHTPSVEVFCDHLVGHLDRLDFIINNACQTVRRPPAYYEHLMAAEHTALGDLSTECQPLLASYDQLQKAAAGRLLQPGGATTAEQIVQARGLTNAPDLAQIALLPEDVLDNANELFPQGRLDQDLQQVDLRDKNSWRLQMHEVSTVELLEVHLVNAVAPFVLDARLKPLMLKVPTRDKHIVNVSAMEGQFYRPLKTDKHPHTNMAKASLNMMTRTSAMDYVRDGIHMNAVDTGWVTDEDPAEIADRKRVEHRFTPPLDIVDGAARIVDPILDGINTGNHVWGQFLKDYKPTDW